MPTGQIPDFASVEDAKDWMFAKVDDPCIDNVRFAYDDGDVGERMAYVQQQDEGCCGSFDAEVTINGRLAQIGCNYGH